MSSSSNVLELDFDPLNFKDSRVRLNIFGVFWPVLGIVFMPFQQVRDAVLKISHNYDIESHETLQAADLPLDPKIIAKEVLNDQYHIILLK